MMTDVESMSRAAVQITRAAPLFDQLVDLLLTHAASAAEANAAEGSARQAELRGVRERLDDHFPEFQRLYFDLLQKHLGPRLPAVLEALSNELVQSYFRAQKAMELELILELQRLAEKMARVVSLDSSGPSPTVVDRPPELAAIGNHPSAPLTGADPVVSSALSAQSPEWIESASANLNGTLPLVL